MAFAQLVTQLVDLHFGGSHLLAERIRVGREGGELCSQLALQYLHLVGRVIEHLAGCGTIGNEFLVALLLGLGLGELLARGAGLFLHVGLLALIDFLRGSCLLEFEPRLGGVDQSHFASGFDFVALVDGEGQ